PHAPLIRKPPADPEMGRGRGGAAPAVTLPDRCNRQNPPTERTRSRAAGDSRSAANKVRRHKSRSSRHRARSYPEGRVVVSDRRALAIVAFALVALDLTAEHDRGLPPDAPLPHLNGHPLGVVGIEVQFLGARLVGAVQPHEGQNQHPTRGGWWCPAKIVSVAYHPPPVLRVFA